ncbi:MAG: hypothetical protein ABSD12_15315 [Paraburkholderia sp.]|jgi:hypothetical protein
MAKCDNYRCPICYPDWKEEEEAAQKRAEDDKQDCVNCWRFYQKKAEAIVSVADPIARNRRINAYGFSTPAAKFMMVSYDERGKVSGVTLSPQVETLPLDSTMVIVNDLQRQLKQGGWKQIRVADDPPIDNTPATRARIRACTAPTAYWQAVDKYQIGLNIRCFRSEDHPNDERYLITLDLGPLVFDDSLRP